MAQNVSLWGAVYPNCPALEVPKQGGGTARYDDASVTTAVASDVTAGKVFLAADGTPTTGTASSGAGGTVWQDGQGYVHLANTSGKLHTARIKTAGRSNYTYIMYPASGGTSYYAADSTFMFEAGASAELVATVTMSGQVEIQVNNIAVAYGNNYKTYTYTLPDTDIEIEMGCTSTAAYIDIRELPKVSDLSLARFTLSTDMLVHFPYITTSNGIDFIYTQTQSGGTFDVPLYKGNAIIIPDAPSVATLSGAITDLGGAYLLTGNADASIYLDPDA